MARMQKNLCRNARAGGKSLLGEESLAKRHFRVYIAESRLYRSLTMKEKIHPKVYKAKITCACGNQVELLSTKGETVHVEICSACHPFFTGKQRFLDTAGRIDRFRKKYANLSNAPASCAAFTPPGWPALREAFEFHPFFSSFPEVRKSTSREPRRGHTFRE